MNCSDDGGLWKYLLTGRLRSVSRFDMAHEQQTLLTSVFSAQQNESTEHSSSHSRIRSKVEREEIS